MSDAVAPVLETENAEPAPVAAAQPQAPVQPDKPEGEAPKSWRDTLPEDIRNSPTLSKFETIEGLAKSYTNLERMMGTEKVPVPKTEEDWDRWYRAAGRPDSVEGYEFAKPEQVPEGLEYSEDLDKRIASEFHKQGLSKQQAAGVREALMGILAEGGAESLNSVKANEERMAQEAKEAEGQLQKEWGKAYEQNGKIAGRAINELFGPELSALFEAKGLGNHPLLVKAAYGMGKKLIGEQTLIGDGFKEETPGDLESKIADHRNKYRDVLYDKSHPDHDTRTRELTALYEKRFG